MWGDVASCTCWTTLCICIWVFVFLFVFLYLCISILHLCIFICPFVFSNSANQPVRRCSAWWTTLSNAAMNHDYTLWCAGAQFAYSITISPCLVHTLQYYLVHTWSPSFILTHWLTRKISGDQNSNFIFEQHKKRICLGLSLGCGSAAHWSSGQRYIGLSYTKLKRQRPSLLILNIMTQLNQTNKEVESHPLPISDEVDWQGCRLMCWSLVESYSALQLSSFSDLHHGHHNQLEVTLPQQIHKYNYLEVEVAIRSTNTIKHHKKIIRSDCLTDLCIVIWIFVFIFPNPSYREIQYSDVLPPLQSWE